MANKKSLFGLKFLYDSPATLTFAFVSIILFALDTFVLKQRLSTSLLNSPTTSQGSLPFLASDLLSYPRLFLYSFGAQSYPVLLCNMIFILLLGPAMEERYGTIVIAIMMLVSALFSGVLNACFCKSSLCGSSAIIFMMIFLNSFLSLSKKKVPVSFVIAFLLFILREIDLSSGGIQIIISIAGGLCGSLFAFLTSPKAKAAKKSASDSGSSPDSNSYKEAEGARKSFFGRRNGRNQDEASDGDETVISSMRFDD